MLTGCMEGRCGANTVRECNFPHNYPYIDLLPAGTQNFWTGSQTCKATASFEAELSDDGLLAIRGCAQGQAMQYFLFPATGGWSFDQKTNQGLQMQKEVYKRLKVSCCLQGGKRCWDHPPPSRSSLSRK